MERNAGLEPVPPAWKAGMLAIEHQFRIWHALRDLNPRQTLIRSQVLYSAELKAYI